MKTNETIFKEITENGVITKQQLQVLKNRSNKAQQDVINYDWLESVEDGYGIPLTKDGSSKVYGSREIDIINNSSPSDFAFKGFYNAGSYLPIYQLNGMEYIPMKEPYIIG